MADPNSVEVILHFLKKNRFTRAEAALRSELNSHSDINGFLEKLALEEKALSNTSENDKGKLVRENHVSGSCDNVEVSKELIVKEIECGTGRSVNESKWKNAPSNEVVGTSNKTFDFSKGAEDSVLDKYKWKFNSTNGPAEPHQSDGGITQGNLSKAVMFEKSKYQMGEALDMVNANAKCGQKNAVP